MSGCSCALDPFSAQQTLDAVLCHFVSMFSFPVTTEGLAHFSTWLTVAVAFVPVAEEVGLSF